MKFKIDWLFDVPILKPALLAYGPGAPVDKPARFIGEARPTQGLTQSSRERQP